MGNRTVQLLEDYRIRERMLGLFGMRQVILGHENMRRVGFVPANSEPVLPAKPVQEYPLTKLTIDVGGPGKYRGLVRLDVTVVNLTAVEISYLATLTTNDWAIEDNELETKVKGSPIELESPFTATLSFVLPPIYCDGKQVLNFWGKANYEGAQPTRLTLTVDYKTMTLEVRSSTGN